MVRLAAILLCLLYSGASLAQNVNVIAPARKAVYDFSSQINWVAFRPRSTDVAVALYGQRDGGKAIVCRSWANKQVKDTTLDKIPSPCFCVAYDMEGARLAWCSWTLGRQICVSGGQGTAKAIDCGKLRITAIAFDPATDGALASIATDGVVRLWDVRTGHKLRQLASESSRGLCVVYSRDGRYLAASFANHHVRLWSTADLDRPPVALDAHSGQVNFIAFAPGGRILASASSDATVNLWDVRTGRRIQTLEHQHLDQITCLAFTPDGRYLASADKSGKVVFWNMESLRPVVAFFPHRQPIYGIAISSDGETMVTGSQDRSVRFFATRDLGYREGRLRLLAVTEKIGLKIDGQRVSFDPGQTLPIVPGTHTVEVTTEDGSNSKTYPVEVTPEADVSLNVDVRSTFGRLSVIPDRPSEIVVADALGQAHGRANGTFDRLTPGTYTVTISPKDTRFAAVSQTVDVKAGETARVTAAMHLSFGDISPPPNISAIKQTRVNPRDGAEMVWIPGGGFTMGRGTSERDARPSHEVTLTGYWIYRAPVTVAQYRAFCLAGRGTTWERKMPPPPKWGWKDTHPMVLVSWEDARAYAEWAFGDNSRVYLPTEAQYERAMQGPDSAEYPWGAAWDTAQCTNSVRGNRPNGTTAVGLHSETSFGLLDIAGNVWEWCGDWYDADYYRRSPPADPGGPANGQMRVIRGGAWDGSNPKLFRSDYRGKAAADTRSLKTGFRCASGQ